MMLNFFSMCIYWVLLFIRSTDSNKQVFRRFSESLSEISLIMFSMFCHVYSWFTNKINYKPILFSYRFCLDGLEGTKYMFCQSSFYTEHALKINLQNTDTKPETKRNERSLLDGHSL